jgi:DNA-binding response OmpR family regulator
VLTALPLGAVDYVVKPFSLSELTIRVEQALRKIERVPG